MAPKEKPKGVAAAPQRKSLAIPGKAGAALLKAPPAKVPAKPKAKATVAALGKAIGALAAAPKAKRRASSIPTAVAEQTAGGVAKAQQQRRTLSGHEGEIVDLNEPDDEPGYNANEQPYTLPKQMALQFADSAMMHRDAGSQNSSARSSRPQNTAHEELEEANVELEELRAENAELREKVSSTGALVPKVNQLMDRFQLREEQQAARLEAYEEHAHQHEEYLQSEIYRLENESAREAPGVNPSELEAELRAACHDEHLFWEETSRARAQLVGKIEQMEEISVLAEQGSAEAQDRIQAVLRESAAYEEDAIAERCACANLLAEVNGLKCEQAAEEQSAEALKVQGEVDTGPAWMWRWARLATLVRFDCWGEVMCNAAAAASRSRSRPPAPRLSVPSSDTGDDVDDQVLKSMLANVQSVKAAMTDALHESEIECAWWETQAKRHEAKSLARLKELQEAKEKEEKTSKQVLVMKMQVTALRSQLAKSSLGAQAMSDAPEPVREQMERMRSQEWEGLQSAEEVAARTLAEHQMEVARMSEDIQRTTDMEEEEVEALKQVREELRDYLDGHQAILSAETLAPLITETEIARAKSLSAMEELDDERLVMEANACRLYSQLNMGRAELRELEDEKQKQQEDAEFELAQLRDELTNNEEVSLRTMSSELGGELRARTLKLETVQAEKDEMQEALLAGVMAEGEDAHKQEVGQLHASLASEADALKSVEAEIEKHQEALENVEAGHQEALENVEAGHQELLESIEVESQRRMESLECLRAENEEHVEAQASTREMADMSNEELSQQEAKVQELEVSNCSLRMALADAEGGRNEALEDLARQEASAKEQQIEAQEAKVQELEVSNCSLRMALADAEDRRNEAVEELARQEPSAKEHLEAQVAELKAEIDVANQAASEAASELIACRIGEHPDEALAESQSQNVSDTLRAPSRDGTSTGDAHGIGHAINSEHSPSHVSDSVGAPSRVRTSPGDSHEIDHAAETGSAQVPESSQILIDVSQLHDGATATPAEVAALKWHLEDSLTLKTQIVALRSALEKRIEQEAGLDRISEDAEQRVLANTAGVNAALCVSKELQAVFQERDRRHEEIQELQAELVAEQARVGSLMQHGVDENTVGTSSAEDSGNVLQLQNYMPSEERLLIFDGISSLHDPTIGETLVTTATHAAQAAQTAALRSAAYCNVEASKLRQEISQLIEGLPADRALESVGTFASLLDHAETSLKPFEAKIDLDSSVAAIRDAQEVALNAVDSLAAEVEETQKLQVAHLRKALQQLAKEALKHIEELRRLQVHSAEHSDAVASLAECEEELHQERMGVLQVQRYMAEPVHELQPSSASRTPSPTSANDVLLLHFPNAVWPAPTSFQTELRQSLIAAGAQRMADVVVRIHEGIEIENRNSIIAELIGSHAAIVELRSLPLMDLVVLGYRVGLIRNPRRPSATLVEGERTTSPPRTPRFAAERELIMELQAAEMQAAVLLEASKADDIEFDELSIKLSIEEHAYKGAEDSCAALRSALESSEVAVDSARESSRLDVEYAVSSQWAQLRRNSALEHEAQNEQLREILMDVANTEIEEQSRLRDHLSMEVAEVAAFKERLSFLEDCTHDPRDTSRAAMTVGSEIHTLMQEQELAANTLGEAVALGSDPLNLAAAASHIATLAGKTAGKSIEAQRLWSEAEIRFSESLQDQRQNCLHWEVQMAAEAMQEQVAVLRRSLDEEIAACHRYEAATAGAHDEKHKESKLEIEEAHEFHMEASRCTSMNVEVAAELASHATELCDAKLAFAKVMADYDEVSEKMQAVTILEEEVAAELATARMDMKWEVDKRSQEEERWEMLVARHEGRAQVLQDVANKRDVELSALRDHLYLEERASSSAEEVSDKLQVMISQEEEMATELANARNDLRWATDKQAQEEERWEMLVARHEGRAQVLEDVANKRDVELSGLRNQLYLEERACWAAEEACAFATSAPEEVASIASNGKFASVLSPTVSLELAPESEDLRRISLPCSSVGTCGPEANEPIAGARDAGMLAAAAAAELSLSRAVNALQTATDVLMDTHLLMRSSGKAVRRPQLQLGNGDATEIDVDATSSYQLQENDVILMEAARSLGSVMAVLRRSRCDLDSAVAEHSSEMSSLRAKAREEMIVATRLSRFQTHLAGKMSIQASEVRSEHNFFLEAELAAERCAKAILHAEVEELKMAAIAEERTRPFASNASKGDFDQLPVQIGVQDIAKQAADVVREHQQVPPMTNSEEMEWLQALACHELEEAEAAEACARQKYEDLHVSAAPTFEQDRIAVSGALVNLISNDAFGSEATFAAITDENELVGEELEQVMAEIHCLHEEAQIPTTLLSTCASSHGDFGSAAADAVENVLSATADGPQQSAEDVSLLAQKARQLALAAATQHQSQLSVFNDECAHWKSHSARHEVRAEHLQKAATASTTEANELSAYLTLEEAAWQSFREASLVSDAEQTCARLEIESKYSTLKQSNLELESQCERLKEELRNVKKGELEVMRVELEKKEIVDNLEQALVIARVEAEKNNIQMEARLQSAVDHALNVKARCDDELRAEAATCQHSVERTQEVAYNAQLVTANMRSQLVTLFEQLDARGEECQSLELQALSEEAVIAELVAKEVLPYQQEAAHFRSERNEAFGAEEMNQLTSSFSSHPGSFGHAAWRNLECMLEDSNHVALHDTTALVGDLNQAFAALNAELHSLIESRAQDPKLSRIALQVEALRNCKDRLFFTLPDAQILAEHEDQLQKCKGMLLSLLPKVAKLMAECDELRESRESSQCEHQVVTLIAECNELRESRESSLGGYRAQCDELRKSHDSSLREHRLQCDELCESRESSLREHRAQCDELREIHDSSLRARQEDHEIASKALTNELRGAREEATLLELDVARSFEAEAELLQLQESARIALMAELTEERDKTTLLELDASRGFELEMELRESRAEVGALEQVAELHAQHALKVHRLMCEDAHQRLSGDRALGGSRHTARSGALRAWQATLASQSQALMERSWSLLNSTTPGTSDDSAALEQPNQQGSDSTARPHALLAGEWLIDAGKA